MAGRDDAPEAGRFEAIAGAYLTHVGFPKARKPCGRLPAMSGDPAMSETNEHLLIDLDKWLLILAHPGHELRAHHLMERVRPAVAVLTDGSGSTTTSRLGESRVLIAHAGAKVAPTFGPLTDREAYAALMAADARPFQAHLDRLADVLITQQVSAVVVDAAEGYNPVHDVCHWIGCAATLRTRQHGLKVKAVRARPDRTPDSPGSGIRLRLDDAAFARKLDAIGRYDALQAEADAAFERYGRDAFQIQASSARGRHRRPAPRELGAVLRRSRECPCARRAYTSVLRYGACRPVIDGCSGRCKAAHPRQLIPRSFHQ